MWVAFLLLLSITCTMVVIYLICRPGSAQPPDTEHDLLAYGEQLHEIEGRREGDALSEEDADRLKRDIYRRILATERKLGNRSPAVQMSVLSRTTVSLLAVLILIPGTYAVLHYSGYRHMPDMPIGHRLVMAAELHASRPTQHEYLDLYGTAAELDTVESGSDASARIALLRERTIAEPDDITAFEMLAAGEASLGNYAAAIEALRASISLSGIAPNASQHVQLALYLIAEANGYVSHEAEAQISAALERDPENLRARYFHGLMNMQTGRPDLAFRSWYGLLDSLQPGDPVERLVRDGLPYAAEAAGIEHNTYIEEMIPMPSEQAAVIMSMPESERNEMIIGMVEGLASRIDAPDASAEEYGMLIVSLTVLGRNDEASRVLERAMSRFAGNAVDEEIIRNAAERAGLR